MTVSRNADSTTLGIDDIEVLIEAVEAWENKDLAGDLMGSMLEGMLTKDAPAHVQADIKAKREADRSTQERARRARKDRSILLRAKLLQLADALRASAFADETLGGQA